MAADLAGTAAIRLVPSLTGFRARAQTELQRQKGLSVDVDIRPRVDTSTARRQLERFRAKEQADAINLKARVDEAEFKRSFQRVEHVFERSAFAKALRLQIKVLGIDALYALTAAGAAAAASLDTLVKGAVILPGALAAAGVAAGVFAVALGDIGKAITAVNTQNDQAADKARALEGAMADGARAGRDVQRAHQDVARATEDIGRAARRAIRDFEDLAHAVRGTSLDEADALLNVQESYDELAAGGFKSLTELRRAQLAYARDLHALDGVRTQNKRTLEDYNEAQRKGLAGSDEVVAAQDRLVGALDAVEDANNRVADAARRMADASQTKTMVGAYSRLAPAAKEFVDAVTAADGAWQQFTGRMQQAVFAGQAKNLNDTLNSLQSLVPALEGVGGSIGGIFDKIGAVLRRDDIQGMLKGIINGTSATLDTIGQGLEPLISGFLRMAEVGVRHLPQLVDVFNRLWERFDAFTQRAAADGTLDRWIENGITGFEQLLLTGENLIGIVSDVANAWRTAGGESTGLIQNAADLTSEIRKWTSSTEGQNSMVSNFRNMRQWLSDVYNSLQNIWPQIKSVVQTVREWSAVFLEVLGYAFQMTKWVEDHTGLVKILVLAYLSIRTVKPIWDALSNAAAAYQNILLKSAASGNQWAANSVNGLANVQTQMGKTGTSAQTLQSTFDRSTKGWSAVFSNAVATAGADMDRLRNGMANTATGATNMGGAATTAATNVGAMGTQAGTAATAVGTSSRVGLWGAVAGLGAFLGPMALAMVATGGIIWAIDKMGEAHRRAAAEAENQKNQLNGLKQSLDQFSGAFTAQTAIDTSRTAQDFQTTGFGKRNILQDIVRTGVASPEALLGATNPVNQAQRDAISEQLTAGGASKLGPLLDRETTGAGGVKSTMRQQLGAAGLSDRDIVGILVGDTNAINRWNDAVGRQPGGANAPGGLPTVDAVRQRAMQDIPPEAWDYITSLQFLNSASNSNVQGGRDIQGANAAALGEAKLRAGATGYGTNPEVRWTSPDQAQIITEAVPNPDEFVRNFPADVGTAMKLPGDRIQINLTREATARDIERKAEGGMIRGSGSGTSDSNMILASRGEYIIRKAAVNAVGVKTLDNLNMGRFWGGGMPFPMAPPTVPPPPINPPAPTTPAAAPYTPTVPAAPAVPTAPAPTSPVQVPTNYPALPAPTTGMPYSPSASGNMSTITGPMGPLGPVSVNQAAEQGPILDYLTKITQQSGLRVGSSVRDEPGSWHNTGNALDIGNGPDAIPLAQWWIQDPARVANTKELILSGPGWDPMMNIKDGKFIRDYGGGVYDQSTLNGHTDHLHLALGGVPIGGLPTMTNAAGQQVTYDPYNPTVSYGGTGTTGVPGTSGSTSSNLPLGERIAQMYQNALKPENVNKFLLGQAQNVGSSLFAIGTSFLSGLTGLDLSKVIGPAQQIMQHFTGEGGSSGSDSQSTLQAGSPMDSAISGGLNSFFDPNAGVNIAGIASSVGGSAHGGAGAGIPGPGPNGVLQYIIQKAMSLGYNKQQAIWFATQAFGESGLNPSANGGNQDGTGDVMGIFQFTPGTWGSRPGSPSDATRNIDEYFNLAKERGLTPQTFTDPVQLGTQVSKGGPYHPANGGHRQKAEAGVAPLLAGLGFAGGGFAGGGVPARVSRGEFRMSPSAVRKYGVGFMNRINAAGGFESGGYLGRVAGTGIGAAPGENHFNPRMRIDTSTTRVSSMSDFWRGQMLRGTGQRSHASIPPSYGDWFLSTAHSMPRHDEGGTPWADPSMPGYQDPATVRQNPYYRGGTPGGIYDLFPEAAHGWNPARLNPFYRSQIGGFRDQNVWGQHPESGLRFARGGVAETDPRAQLQQPTTGSAAGSIMGGIQEGAGIIGGYAQQAMAERGIQIPGFAAGGLPAGMIKPIIPAPRPTIKAQPKIAAPRPAPSKPTAPKAPVQGAAPKAPAGAPHGGTGAPAGPPSAPGVPAPTPGPGAPPVGLPGADRNLSMVPGLPSRGSGDYLNPAIRQGIEEGFNHAGALGAAAAASGMGGAGIPGGGAAGMLIQGGAQVAGKFASGVANVVSAAMIGNLTEIGTGPTPSGTPLLPSIAPRSFPELQTPDQVAAQTQRAQGGGGGNGPLIMNVYNGGIHTNNMDEWNRRRQLLERQQEQPLTNTFAH